MHTQKKELRRPRKDENVPRANITLHLPGWMLNRIRSVANDCDVPCETVIKVWVAEKILSREKALRQSARDGGH